MLIRCHELSRLLPMIGVLVIINIILIALTYSINEVINKEEKNETDNRRTEESEERHTTDK